MADGDPTPLPNAEPSLVARFLGMLDRSGDCWVWTAGRYPSGYGKFLRTGAHRVAWTLFVGPIPEGLWVLHGCDNPPCCRPGDGHLFLGTAQDNADDMWAKGRGPSGDRNGSRLHPERLPRGDRNGARRYPDTVPRGASRWNARLTDEQVREIRRAEGRQREIAALFEVSQCTVSDVRRGKRWKHVR